MHFLNAKCGMKYQFEVIGSPRAQRALTFTCRLFFMDLRSAARDCLAIRGRSEDRKEPTLVTQVYKSWLASSRGQAWNTAFFLRISFYLKQKT